MANQNNSQRNTSANQDSGKLSENGRTSGSQDPAIEQTGSRTDISAIDQQEGNLKHGECGAGMECEDDKM